MRVAPSRPSTGPAPVGPTFVTTYTLAYMSVALMLIAPLLVTLALKIRSLVGAEQAPQNLAIVTGIGGLLSLIAGPVFGRLSDRTPSRFGMRRPWMVGGLAGGVVGIAVVATAPQRGRGADRLVPRAGVVQRSAGRADGGPPRSGPHIAARDGLRGAGHHRAGRGGAAGTFLVQLFEGNQAAMFLTPCAIGAVFVVFFAGRLDDRRLAGDVRPWSLRDLVAAFHLNPRRSPDFSWAFIGRFLFISAYAFLTTYQAYYLIERVGSAEGEVPRQVFLATLVQSVVLVVASLAGGRLSDRTGRRKVFVATAAVTYGVALFVIAAADSFDGFLVGMAISGLGFGAYLAVDLALVTDVLP